MSVIPRVLPDYSVEKLADALLEWGEIDPEQRRQISHRSDQSQGPFGARGQARSFGASSKETPAESVAHLHLTASDGTPLDEDRVMKTVARLAGLPYEKIDPLKLNHGLITETMTRAFARRHACVPLRKEGRTVTFAIDNPFDQNLLHQLSQLVAGPGSVRFVVSAKRDILRVITEIYGFQTSVKAAERDIVAGVDLGNLEQLVRLKKVDELEANDQHIVNAVEYLLHYAYGQRASDIHLEPGREEARVRLRIDGVLHEIFRVPMVVQRAMASRLKTLARMDIAERRRPQDGRIKTVVGDRQTELRVSSAPMAFGEKLVLRIFDPDRLVRGLDELGMDKDQLAAYQEFLDHRTGMILVTGPTGSGKTTTLYSTLHRLANPEVNIITIEDPIEMVFEELNQVLVQRKIDLDFANALRSILRQDPDIIMVGEIRDPETAQMAAQAALTGHLVFSTLHTNDTASSVTRLRDLGLPPYLVSSVLVGVVAQRLVRLVCDACACEAQLDASQAAALEIPVPPGSKTRLPVRRGAGCPRCRDTGLYARTGVYELFSVTDTTRRLIREDSDAKELFKAARADGMVTLRESAIRHLAEGRTTFEEVMRVLGA
jgi:general secretion pathway protein E